MRRMKLNHKYGHTWLFCHGVSDSGKKMAGYVKRSNGEEVGEDNITYSGDVGKASFHAAEVPIRSLILPKYERYSILDHRNRSSSVQWILL